MSARSLRSIGLLAAVALAAGGAFVHCAAPAADDEPDLSADQITGVNNALGLGLRYDDTAGRISATLSGGLQEGEKLFVRVRRGKMTQTSQTELDCTELAKDQTRARPVSGSGVRELTGKIVYQGQKVDKSVFDLVHLYADPHWATGAVPQTVKDDIAKYGPDPIVEACIMKGDKVRAKLQTNLAYAWDQNTKAEATLSKLNATLRFASADAGLEGQGDAAPSGGNDAGDPSPVAPAALDETTVNSQIEYGELCVQELGEIPFFKKLGQGKYDTFDCRNLVGMSGDTPTGPIAGVEGSHIPVTVDGVEQDKCSPGQELGPDSQDYGCMAKADHGMFLATGRTQPGPMVVTARNDKGSHWLLLCRKVADDGKGMTRSTRFNDMAMIGHNPRTGRTCFFQNSIGSGKDGSHVPHPADVEKSTSVWSSSVQSYCSGTCHGESPFVHSPWIDNAKRANGKPIVPKVGENPDFLISDLSAPYNIVAADKLGFSIPKQLVSDEVGACNNCHRLAGGTLQNFASWATGTGDDYFANITDTGKKFESSHWMAPRLDGLDEGSWANSKYGQALAFMKKCNDDSADPACIWADVPRGNFDNPKVGR